MDLPPITLLLWEYQVEMLYEALKLHSPLDEDQKLIRTRLLEVLDVIR